MNTKLSRRMQKRAWMVLMMLVGAILGLPLSALPLSALWSAGSQSWHGTSAPDVDGPFAAKIAAAQLPLWATGDYQSHLPMIYGPDDRPIMPMQTTLPWGAVGYVDNGCTGVLIDSQHVLAAAHCYTYDYATPAGDPFQQGDWQTPLYFFPNYHPDRANPPYYAIDRVVVGTRVETGGEYIASDWGIGHLATPVTGFPALQIEPVPSPEYPVVITYAGYARDLKRFPDKPYPQPPPGGFCPYFGPNCWWTPALVVPECLALNDNDNAILLDSTSCLIQGGNSGSPLIWNKGTPASPVYRLTGVVHGYGVQPAAPRFEHAPRFAGGVALASYDDGSARTQVFASDGDSNRVLRRYRDGTTIADGFTPFTSLGRVSSPGRMAAFKLTNNRPQVVVIAGSGDLYTTYVDSGGSWQPWTTLTKPAGVSAFLDVDAAYDSAGTNQLYAIGDDGLPYTRRRLSTDPYAGWDSWQALASSGDYHRLSAIRRADGTQQVFLVNTSGSVYTLWQTSSTPGSGWTQIYPFVAGGLPTTGDLDAAWTESEQVQVFAVTTGGDLWSRTMVTSSPGNGWYDWVPWPMELYAPQAATPPVVDDIVTLTASLWQEPTGGDIVPVVLATDSQGNIYYTTHATATGWEPWRSFYH